MMKFAAMIFFSLLALAIANAEDKAAEKATEKSADKPAASKSPAAKPAAAKPSAIMPKDVKKLMIEDAILGNGKSASKGKSIKVHYTGWLYDPLKPMGRGKQFDTSSGKDPFTFQLGAGQVIKGWDEGFDNMKVGGKRKIIIPSEMGYGTRGAGAEIPPNAPLMFEVELLDVM